MAKVICTLPNASSVINGIKFVTHKLGMISEEIEDSVAKDLAAIRGYQIHGQESPGPVVADTSNSVSKATPESLAEAAASLSAEDHGKLIDLLFEQERPSAPPARGVSNPDAPTAPSEAKDGSVAPSSSGSEPK